jgi:formylglycine-generating enzyme required for sulfatase activity
MNAICRILLVISCVSLLGCGSSSERITDGQQGGMEARSAGELLIVDLPNEEQIEFTWVPAGSFIRGSSVAEIGRKEDEGPMHEVRISSGFYLGRHEVTQGEWIAVMETIPWLGEDFMQLNADHPAVYVNWPDAQAFVRALNAAANDSLYRLPTEAEWEYAARAGSAERWAMGDDEERLGDYAWFRDNAWDSGLRYAQRVGTKSPNIWGLFDMHGNVSEWCQDLYGPYRAEAQLDPRGVDSGASQVVRGGAFNSRVNEVRVADRSASGPGYRRNFNIGFRIVRIK